MIIVEPTTHSIISGEVKVNPSECEHAVFGKSLEDLTPPSDLFEHDSQSQGLSKQSPRAVAEFKNYTSGGVQLSSGGGRIGRDDTPPFV